MKYTKQFDSAWLEDVAAGSDPPSEANTSHTHNQSANNSTAEVIRDAICHYMNP